MEGDWLVVRDARLVAGDISMRCWCDGDQAGDVRRSHFHDLCGDRRPDTMSDKKRRPYITNQRHERRYSMLSRRLKQRAGPGGPPYAWPIDDESGPSLLS